MVQHKVDTLSPAGHLALTAALSTPANPITYPDRRTWVWLAGIDEQYAAFAYSVSDGLDLFWNGPEYSNSRSRVRSVVR